MDWSILSSIMGALVGGGGIVGAIMSVNLRKANRRKAEAEAKAEEFASFKEQISELHEMLTFERDRNKELMKINIEKEDRIQEKDRFIGEQTKRLRGTQDREHQLRLAHNALQLMFKDEKCIKHGCPYREPENAYSKRAKLQLDMVGVDLKALPPCEEATIIDVEVTEEEEDGSTDYTVEN